MLFKLLILVFSSSLLFSQILLQKNYYVATNDIMLSDIIQNPSQDFKLFTIIQGRYTKRVKTKILLEKLHSYGYKAIKSSTNYIKFIKQTPIDVQPIKNFFTQNINPTMIILILKILLYIQEVTLKNFLLHIQ